MAKTRATRLARIAVLTCVVAGSWFLSASLARAAGVCPPDAGLPVAQLSGKLDLELSSECEPPAAAETALDLSFEGTLHIPFGSGMRWDITVAASPCPVTGEVHGHAEAEMNLKPGGGFELDLGVRGGRSSDSDNPGDRGGECVSSSLAASASWEGSDGAVSCKGAYAETGWAYPYRPTRDRVEREVSGYVKVAPSPALSVRVDATRARNEYRVAYRNTSTTSLASVEASHKWGKAAAVIGLRVEAKDKRYPSSASKTYHQVSWEATASFEPLPGFSVESSASRMERHFPFASEGDLYAQQVELGASIQSPSFSTVSLVGTVSDHAVPLLRQRWYVLRTLEVKYEASPFQDVAVCAGATSAKKQYLEPAASRGDYEDAAVYFRLVLTLTRDLEVTGEVELVRREYPLRQSSSTYKVKSLLALVYRI